MLNRISTAIAPVMPMNIRLVVAVARNWIVSFILSPLLLVNSWGLEFIHFLFSLSHHFDCEAGAICHPIFIGVGSGFLSRQVFLNDFFSILADGHKFPTSRHLLFLPRRCVTTGAYCVASCIRSLLSLPLLWSGCGEGQSFHRGCTLRLYTFSLSVR